MKLKYTPTRPFELLLLVLLLGLLPRASHANVYATNIKLNDGMTNIVSPAGTNIQISYILNEPASRVEIDIVSGANVVRRMNLTDSPSTSRGTNAVSWDGLDNNSNQVPAGTYQVSITVASTGYTDWTHISSDDDLGAGVWWGEGIAVDRNATSPFYGRVFVANAQASGVLDGPPGAFVGIMKMNADATNGDEGGTSADQDGYPWSDDGISPWKIAVSDDDFVYVDDLGTGGQVLRWDPLVSSNSLTYMLRKDNQPPGARLSGPAIVGTGTNTQIWMTDTNDNSLGIIRWLVGTNGICATNDLGTVVVASNASLTLGPTDVAVDKSGNIYTCQSVIASQDPRPRVFRFPAYDPSTNGGKPELVADWAVGAADDTYAGANAIAVDPTGTYVAVAFGGTSDGFTTANGNTKVLYATNGALVANLDLGMLISDINHSDTACGWDAVGNVYYVDWFNAKWRVVSPPGTNQSTTMATGTIQITSGGTSGPPPTITSINNSGSTVTIDFTALATDTPASFLVVGAANVIGPYSQVAGATIVQMSPGIFRATVTNSGGMQYFRIQRVGGSGPPSAQPPTITSLAITGANAVITFTGQTTDTPALFKLLNSLVAAGPYATNTSASITQTGPGVFQASVPTSGPIQFYRLQR